MSQDLSLKHLMLLEKLHLGLQIAEVGSIVFRHLLHPLGHPLLSLTDRPLITSNKQTGSLNIWQIHQNILFI